SALFIYEGKRLAKKHLQVDWSVNATSAACYCYIAQETQSDWSVKCGISQDISVVARKMNGHPQHKAQVPSNPLDALVPCPGPYLFYSIGMKNQFPHYRQPVVLPHQVPMPHASPSMSSLPSSKSKSTTNEENPQPGATKRNHGSNWTDMETRYLLELWRDNFPISKKRNSTEWDAIAKKLNSTFKDQGIPCYCTGTQCKACIKYLQDQYK
ncbi:unnamed protein product, partial [Pocillopora meandrina]